MESKKKRAYENLRYRIITQELPPGELLKDADLMAEYGIGRTPLREVLIELQRQGLIRRVPRTGTWVAPMDLAYVRQIVEIRVHLEGLAGELAAERITEAELAELSEILNRARAGQESEPLKVEELITYESQFHHVIYRATRNRRLEELLIEFQGIGARFWHSLVFNKAQLFKLFDEQEAMLDALKQRDARLSRELMARHTRAYFEPGDAGDPALIPPKTER